jgi:excinuclease ABC subunit A
LGTRLEIDPDLVIPNKKLTLAEGAIRPWARISGNTQAKQLKLLAELARRHGFDLNTPVGKLTPAQLSLVLYGEQNAKTAVPGVDRNKQRDTYEGVATNLLRRYGESNSTYLRQEIEKYMRIQRCSQCHGLRLKPEVLAVTLQDKHISQLAQMTLIELKDFLRSLKFSRRLRSVVEGLLKEILLRLDLIIDIGLGYLALDRTVASLSGGELQKIRLATQIGSNLTGVLYVLDEPSVGLHERDNKKLIKTLKRLQAMGNTVIVVEHDAAMIGAADWVLDIGPGAGKNGGEIIAQGKPVEIKKNKNSLTGAYLAGRKKIEVKKNSQRGNGKYLEIIGAGEFNLKNINVKIPLGKFVCITGVSGSGKSTLMDNILARALARHFYQAKELPGRHKEMRGLQHINKVVSIDQSPIGRTPRSNPATYTGVFTYIRELWARQPEAKIKGFDAGHFSFNVKGGRCEACQGDGEVKIEMHFLPDVYVECEVCHGKRYNQEALEIYWHDKNIADVLAMTVEEALEFFADEQQIVNKLKILYDVGLGYLELGQPAPTLSGGEAQRIKLATELSRRETGKTLYILDEPTIGLHFEDVNKLLDVLNRLVDKGNTVLVIEHNLDVIKNADWIIDLGPEGGDKGGEVVAAGTPQQVAKVKRSYTGQYLKAVL